MIEQFGRVQNTWTMRIFFFSLSPNHSFGFKMHGSMQIEAFVAMHCIP